MWIRPHVLIVALIGVSTGAHFALGASPASDLSPQTQPVAASAENQTPTSSAAMPESLRAMGPDAVPQLLDALKSPSGHTRLLAAAALGAPTARVVASEGEPAIIAALAGLLDDASPGVAAAASHSLCDYGLDAHPFLIKAIKAGNKIVKAEVIDQLLTRPHGFTDDFMRNRRRDDRSGLQKTEDMEAELAKLVAPGLVELFNAKKTTDAAALRGLSCLPPQGVGKEVVEIVRISVNDFQFGMSVGDATATLAALGPAGKPALIDACNSENGLLRSAAIAALAGLPASTHDADLADIMLDAMSDPLDTTRLAAFRWTIHSSKPTPPLVERVAKMLVFRAGRIIPVPLDINEADHLAAVRLLENFPCKSGGDVLIMSLNDESPDIRMAAIAGLRAYRDAAKSAMPKLVHVTLSDSPAEADAAAETLMTFGKDGRVAAAEFYIRRLEDVNRRQLIPQTLHQIGTIGPEAAGAVPILQGWLASRDNDFRILVADTLGQIGPSAAAAAPTLVRMVDNPDSDIRQSASTALVKIAPDGKGLAPALLAAIYNSDRAAADRLAVTLRQHEEGKPLLARLDDLAANDSDAGVRATAHRARELLAPEQ